LQALAALRVLVIDDNEQIRNIVGTILSGAGIRQLYYAADGRRGMDVITQGSVDLVFVDHEMPVMNGLDFISRVRSLESNDRYMPIIMLTGHSDLFHVDRARDRGVTEFLCKPVMAKTIISRLNMVIMNPRPFVFTDNFFGPDRRRSRTAKPDAPMRRLSDRSNALAL
jgi:two-component system chemotaxis response regulator CheY